MTENKKYNGYTNYATWRINLEMISDQQFHLDELYIPLFKKGDTYKLAGELEEFVLEYLLDQGGETLTYNYACAFVAEVNFYEIAEHIIHDYELAHCGNCNDQLDYDTSYDGYCSKECANENEVLLTHEKG